MKAKISKQNVQTDGRDPRNKPTYSKKSFSTGELLHNFKKGKAQSKDRGKTDLDTETSSPGKAHK